mgnify:CR=1 FL=1
MSRKILRRITQAAGLVLALLIPALDLLRYDISARTLYLSGQLWAFAPEGKYLSGAGGNPVQFLFKGVLPWALVFISLPVLGAVIGRFSCGWFCPVGAIFEIADFFRRKLTGFKRCWTQWRHGDGRACRKELFSGLLTVLSIVISLLIAGAFFSGLLISPSEIWRQISSLEFSPFFIIVNSAVMAMIVGTYIARRAFCSYVCLFGITMTIPFVVSPLSLRIRFDTTRASLCTNCGRCDRACIMDIKPRAQNKKINPRCINCGECITACEQEQGRKRGLLYYGFGAGKKNPKKSRKATASQLGADRLSGGSIK